ncbi:hypothetical protein [Chromobacterium rhizoryzae]|uniref:hypothetical protein n=1 Tax=Chromobacterium rhizoryzae TaxID=1778675 RepID=UPI0013C367F4|nr:hypothetical protein [Chromobacterium rhizoryzae]
MPLALLSSLRYESIELKSSIAGRESVTGGRMSTQSRLEYEARRDGGGSFIVAKAIIGVSCWDDEKTEVFTLSCSIVSQFDFDMEMTEKEIEAYICNDEDRQRMQLQLQPVINAKVFDLIGGVGLLPSLGLSKIVFGDTLEKM